MNELTIFSWNIEHFNGNGGIDKSNKAARINRVDHVANYIKEVKPDVFALLEVEGSTVFEKMTNILPEYVFNITEGNQTQEILVAVKHGLTAFFTQRNEFKRSNPNLRPAALLTIKKDNVSIPILFTHLKSMDSPEGFGLRDAMFDKIYNLKKSLDKAAQSMGNEAANFIILGDLNTMGLNYEGQDKDINSELEIKVVTKRFSRRGMVCLKKDHGVTFNNGSKSEYPSLDLDHVFASKHLTFEPATDNAFVRVGGWAKLNSVHEQDEWISKFSDHAPIQLKLLF